MRILKPYIIAVVALFVATLSLHAQDTTDQLTQKWTSETYGYGFDLPDAKKVKYNKLASEYNPEGESEHINFIIRGGKGAITIDYYTEQRMVPPGFQLRSEDSLHYFDRDSVGSNGRIIRRTYIMLDHAVSIQILLTDKGEPEFGPLVPAILDSFRAPANAVFALQEWRYGRDPSEFERGRYEHNKND